MNGYDIAWGAGLVVSAPFWLARGKTRTKVLRALRERMGNEVGGRGEVSSAAIMIHAVSLGEINATRAMLNGLSEARPDLRFIITVTTDTGYARGVELYGKDPRVTLLRYPLDFSLAIVRLLEGLRPGVVVLMELEVWPNFMVQCERRGIPVLLVNGRLTPGSFRNYRLGGPPVRKMFGRLAIVCAQEEAYAKRFIQLGAPRDRVRVTGTMKFDTAQIAERIDGDVELAADLGLEVGKERVWLCGSTGPGEEALVLKVYRALLDAHPKLRLVIVPRKPERFDEVATEILGSGFALIRRSGRDLKSQISDFRSQISDSKSQNPVAPAVILGDTMGELRKFYSLADVVFVGRSLVDLGSRQHGSDMIEPAALAKPVVVGPFTGNFAEVMNRFRAADAMVEVSTVEELRGRIERWLADPGGAKAMGRRAQDVVRQERGATERHIALILKHLPSLGTGSASANVAG